MAQFEYRVVPAPKKGVKIKGVKSTEDQFAHALSQTMNAASAEGWEYLRTDTLPCEERSGLTGRTTVFQNMLVFRRMTAEAARDALRTAVQETEATRALAPAPAPRRLTAPPPAAISAPAPTVGPAAAPDPVQLGETLTRPALKVVVPATDESRTAAE